MNVVHVDFSTRWHRPIRVVDLQGDEVAVVGPSQALRYLNQQRKNKSGSIYWQAVTACALCVHKRVDPALARAHFVTACLHDQIQE